MGHAVTLVRLLPLPFLGRLGIAFVELTLAVFVVSASVVVGHDLKQWRAWYWDPSTTHPWAPTPAPTDATASAAPAATVAIAVTPNATLRPATPAPPCRPSTGSDQLAFARVGGPGAECVWIAQQPDGAHLVVSVDGVHDRDMGWIAPPQGMPGLRVYTPESSAEPVLVVTNATTTSVLVFTWERRGLIELLRTGGERIDLVNDSNGWPQVMVYTRGTGADLRIYRWNGASFGAVY